MNQKTFQHRKPQFLVGNQGSSDTQVSAGLFLPFALLATVVVAIAAHANGFYALGADDFGKLKVAYNWSNSPSFAPNKIWMPLEFYLTGLITHLTGNVYTASVYVNLFWSAASCVVTYYLAKYAFGPKYAHVAVILLVCFPWHIWTSIAGQGESQYYCLFLAVTYAALRWIREASRRWLVLTSLIMVPVTALRHQGWILALLLASYLVVLSFVSKPHRKHWKSLAPCLLLIFAFPAIWLAYNAYQYGDAFYFMHSSDAESARVLLMSLGSWLKAGRFLIYIFLVCPLLSPFILVGAWKLKSLQRNEALFYGIVCFGYLGTIMLLFAVRGGMSYYVEQRYVLPTVYLCMPLVAVAIVDLRLSRYWKILIVSACCIWGVCSAFRCTHELTDEIIVSQYVRDLEDKDVLKMGAKAFIHRRDQNGQDYRFDATAVAILCGEPEFVVNANKMSPAFEEAVADSAQAVLAFLDDNKIKIVMTDSRTCVSRMQELWHYEGSLSGFKIFFIPDQIPAGEPLAINHQGHTFGHQWSNGIELLDVNYYEPEFPHVMVARWRLPADKPRNFKVIWEFTPIVDGKPTFNISSIIGNGLEWEHIKNSTVSDRIIIGLTDAEEKRTGRYTISVRLIDTDEDTATNPEDINLDQEMCFLGTVNIIFDKKNFLLNFLNGDISDVGLAAKIAWSLIN